MKKTVIFLLLIVASLVSGCSSTGTTPGMTGTGASQYSVIIENSTFQTETLKIKAGGTVNWTYKDSYNHTITSLDNSFDSGEISQGKSFSFRFDKPGNYGYFCKLHFQLNPTLKAQALVVVE